MSLFCRKVAFRYLRSRRQQGFVSVIAGFSFLGILLGVATLIIVMSVMNGFRHELLGRILGINGHVAVYANHGHLSDYDVLADQIRGIPGVTGVFPMVERQTMAMSSSLTRGALVHGLTREALIQRPLIAHKVQAGELDNFQGQTAVVGYKLADKLGVRVGDALTLAAPEGTQTALGTLPRFRKFKVVATFDVGMNEYDNTFVFIPLDAAQKFFATDGGITGFEIFVQDPQKVQAPLRVVETLVRGKNLRVFDWQRANASFFSVIEVERNVMFIILTLIVVVAAFNVISSLIMLVKDKTQDIAILRTMGATPAMIRHIFMLTGTTIGAVGTLLGTLLGLGVAANMETIRKGLEYLTGTHLFPAEFYFLSQLPAKVDPWEVVIVVALTLSLTFLATLYPASKAAHLPPVDALRYG